MADTDAEYRKNFANRKPIDLIPLADMEVVMLSCKVSKFNKYNWQQERALVITQENIYNFKLKSRS